MKALLWICATLLCCLASGVSMQEDDTTTTTAPKGRRHRARNDIVNRTVATATRREDEDDEEGGGEGARETATRTEKNFADLTSTMQRINERLAALQALDEQQLRRLQTLEYKLTKMEIQNQERMEGLRTELREVNRRVQQVDWVVNKMEATVEGVKLDTTGLRQGQDSIRGLHSFNSNLNADETEGKLQAITSTLHGIKGTLTTVHREVSVIGHNMTLLSNVTRMMSSLRGQLLTKQHFTTGMLDLKQDVSRRAPTAVGCPPTGRPDEARPPGDCWEVRKGGANQSGVYRIHPPGAPESFYAYCRQDVMGGGWTVLQHRNEGSVDFYKGWQDYKHGFGNLAGEFWLGLQKTHILTNYGVQELLIELQDFERENVTAHYAGFAVGSEIEGYPISFIGTYEGTAGDCMTYHAGNKFSAYDLDNDAWPDGNCAESHTGGWWYKGCDTANLNGRYLNGETPTEYEYQGMYWYDWHGPGYSLKSSRISVRPYQGKPPTKPKGKSPKTVATDNSVGKESTTMEPSSTVDYTVENWIPAREGHVNFTADTEDADYL